MVIYRENTEDIYAGIDWQGNGELATKFLSWLKENSPKDFDKIRFGSKKKRMRGKRFNISWYAFPRYRHHGWYWY